ncbi:MAG: hypothetical protein IPN67_20150 [Bacteroidales bacterium]|nr:hypothetical protein [Bacteroidales bacterium]
MKTTKKSTKFYYVLAVVTLISSVSLQGQKSGVFRTYSDYTTGKMEYGIDCATEKHKIILNDFLSKDFIKVVHEGKRFNLKKNEIWGFQMCDDKVNRFRGRSIFYFRIRVNYGYISNKMFSQLILKLVVQRLLQLIIIVKVATVR